MNYQKFFLFFGLLLLLGACGYKGPVRLPAAKQPGPVSDIELRQQGENLLLSWKLPGHNLDGSPLRQAPQLDIFRQTFDPANDCPECLDRSALLVSIDPGLPAPARQIDEHYLFVDRDLAVGTGYRYKLVPRSSDGSGQPRSLSRVFLQPPPAPDQFQATPLDRSARLSWHPYQPVAGETLLGYQLYRRGDSIEATPVALAPEPLPTTDYEDFGLENGTRYFYRVRTLVKRGEQVIEGIASPELAVTPKAVL